MMRRSGPALLPAIAAALLFALVVAGTSTAVRPQASTTSLTWSHLSIASAPSARAWTRAAFDPTDNLTVLYGGFNGGSFFTDTWTFKGGAWQPLHPSSHPTASTGLLLAYFPPLKGVIAFGGQGPFGSAYYNDTWLFHGGNWTQLLPAASPPARSDYSMAYDAASSQLLLFGGFTGSGSYLSDTWEFNGTRWSLVTSHLAPEGREGGSMVYDSATGRVLLIGGTNASSGAVPGTWSFYGGQWHAGALVGTTPLEHFGLLTALGNGTPILFGGHVPGTTGPFNLTYEFFGFGWHPVNTTQPAPIPLNNGAFVFDARDGYVLLFGGFALHTGVHLGDSWTLQ